MNLQNIIQKPKMRIERFSQLVDAYGGDAKRWPIKERAAALKLLKESVEARRLQRSASNLDHLLDSVPISPPTAMLKQRILAQTQRYTEPAQDAWQWFIHWLIGTTVREHFLRPAFALIIPLLFGLLLGFNLSNLPTPTEENLAEENFWVEEEISLLALGPME
jgi:hypothetical protein